MRRLEEGFRKKDATFGSIFLQVGPPATWKELIKNKFIRIMSSNLKLMKMQLALLLATGILKLEGQLHSLHWH